MSELAQKHFLPQQRLRGERREIFRTENSKNGLDSSEYSKGNGKKVSVQKKSETLNPLKLHKGALRYDSIE